MRIFQPLVLVLLASMSFVFFSAQAETRVDSVPGEYLVKVRTSVQLGDFEKLGQMLNAQVKRAIPEHHILVIQRAPIETTTAVIQELKKNSIVITAEPNYIFRAVKTPNDPLFPKLWGLENSGQSDGANPGAPHVDIAAEKAWDITTGSEDVIVAVIDTGMDLTHPDLKENLWTNEVEAHGQPGIDDDGNGYIDDIHGINVYEPMKPTGNPQDDHGHGSHCAGVIGARGNDDKGIVGVNWQVKIMPVKFLGPDGGGTMEGAIKAIDYAVKMKARILSNSWGGAVEEATLLKEAVQRAHAAGALFIAAAGNDSNNIDDMDYYPAKIEIPSIVVVGAIDNRGNLAPFSNFGKASVHVAAPGVNIYSSVVNGYTTWSGTSMATPHVAGVAALLLAYEPSLSHMQLKDRILKGVRTFPSLRSKIASNGAVNAYYSLINEEAPPNLDDPYYWETKEIFFETEHPYQANAKSEFEVTVPGAQNISVYFEKFDLEKKYDKVEFLDRVGNKIAEMTGTENRTFSPPIPGDYVKIRFTSDDSVNRFGFVATKAAYR